MLETEPYLSAMLYVKKTANVTGIRITVHMEKSVFEYRVIAICIQWSRKSLHLTQSLPLVSKLVTSFQHIICGTQVARGFSGLLKSSPSDQSYSVSMRDRTFLVSALLHNATHTMPESRPKVQQTLVLDELKRCKNKYMQKLFYFLMIKESKLWKTFSLAQGTWSKHRKYKYL